MKINNIYFNAELSDILSELQNQLRINQINLLNRTKEGPHDIQVQCPYHHNGQERKPSAGIKKSDGTFHCFSCGETHTLQEMITHCFGHDEDLMGTFGWNWLLKNFLTISVEERKDVQLDFGRIRHNNRVCEGTSELFVSEETLDSYRYYHPYMEKRGLTDEVIEIFDIGYDKNTSCITFPIRDISGNTLYVARRSVKSKFFQYPEGVEKPVYGLYEVNRLDKFPDEVIICESMLDALVFWTVGKYAVALNGLGNELQFKQLNSMPCRKFILCTDCDEAGMKARKRIRRNLGRKLITEYLFPNRIKDANECTTNLGKESLLELKEIIV